MFHSLQAVELVQAAECSTTDQGLALLTELMDKGVPRLSCPTGASASTLRQLIAAAAAMNAALTTTAAAGSAALALGSLNGGGHGLES